MSAPKPYYESDAITLYCGDCRDILASLPKAGLVLTDPPYGLKWSGGTLARDKKYEAARKWDVRLSDADLQQVISAGHTAVIWGGNLYNLPPCRGYLAWFKTNAVPTMADFELAWTNADRPAKAWVHHNNLNNGNLHPTQKPLPLMVWCLNLFPNAELILDPFAGSGTTLVAAKNLKRRAIGIEIEESYCELAVERLRQEVFDFTSASKPEQLSLGGAQ